MNIEKIEINGHYVWVNKDEEIKEGDYVYVSCSEIEVTEICQVSGYYNEQFLFKHNSQIHMDYCKKIIAASSELNLEGVPTYVEWLAEQYARKECEDMYNQISLSGAEWGWETKNDFTKGYQTAEKELPTWDDVRKAIELAKEGLPIENPMYSEEEIIEKLKQEKDDSKID